jgi:hypothetical protein
MSATPIRLRYPAVCSGCRRELPARTEAVWDRGKRAATCLACLERAAGAPPGNVDGATPDAGDHFTSGEQASPLPLVRGEAGASARRRYERLHTQRETSARRRYGRLGGIYLALTNESQSTRAWATGSRGERALGAYLEKLHNDSSIIVLHDRRIPGSRANIDHLAITPTGIYVIDAKNYTGKVQKLDKGGWFSTDLHLYVGRRDCTRLITGMTKQVEAVRAALAHPSTPPIHPCLCVVDAEWSLFARPFTLAGVWIGWANALGARLTATGQAAPAEMQAWARQIARSLPAA